MSLISINTKVATRRTWKLFKHSNNSHLNNPGLPNSNERYRRNPANSRNTASTRCTTSSTTSTSTNVNAAPFGPFNPLSIHASVRLCWRKWTQRFENLLRSLHEFNPTAHRDCLPPHVCWRPTMRQLLLASPLNLAQSDKETWIFTIFGK